MLARFNWRLPATALVKRLSAPTGQAGRYGRRLIGGLTLLLLLWLVVRLLWRPAWFHALPAAVGELVQVTELAGAFTLAAVWGVLWWRRRLEARGPVPVMDVAALYALSPREFEQFVARLFRAKGYRVRVRGRSGDAGVDLELGQENGRRAVVQCKRYRTTVGPEVVRELYGTLIHEQVAHAFLVTTANVSDAAREWARGKPITLIDGPTLAQITVALNGRRLDIVS